MLQTAVDRSSVPPRSFISCTSIAFSACVATIVLDEVITFSCTHACCPQPHKPIFPFLPSDGSHLLERSLTILPSTSVDVYMLAQCANGLGNNSNEACRRITNGGPLVSPYSCFTQYFIRCSLHVQLLHCVDNEVNAAVLFLRTFVMTCNKTTKK